MQKIMKAMTAFIFDVDVGIMGYWFGYWILKFAKAGGQKKLETC